MKRRTHLFVAPLPWGEIVHGSRIAQALAKRGDRVLFLAPRGTSRSFAGSGLSFVPFRLFRDPLDRIVTDLVRKERCSSLVLVDAGTFYPYLAFTRTDPRFLSSLDVVPIALDVWDLETHGTIFDHGRDRRRLPAATLEVRDRLLPVPFLKPTRRRGVYAALPPASVPSRRERSRARAKLGFMASERVVLMSTSAWQLPEHQVLPPLVKLARMLPELVAAMLGELDRSVRVVQVGTKSDAALARTLGARYRHLSAMSPRRFSELCAAVDLVLTFNVSSTVIGTAIASQIPVLLGINSRQRRTLPPFYLWPTGLYRFMSQVLTKNPYTEVFRSVEVLDKRAFLRSLNELLFDERVRDAAREKQAAYVERVARLPAAADWVDRYLS